MYLIGGSTITTIVAAATPSTRVAIWAKGISRS
jgi:hypothetical protein